MINGRRPNRSSRPPTRGRMTTEDNIEEAHRQANLGLAATHLFDEHWFWPSLSIIIR